MSSREQQRQQGGRAVEPEENISEEEKSQIRKELALREIDTLRGQERDIMQARYQALVGSVTLVSVFSFFLAVPGTAGYALAVCPWLIACIARYAGGGETSLRIIRLYLRHTEKRYDYRGYEQFYDLLDIKQHGGGVKGLLTILLLLETLASSFVVLRLWGEHERLSLALMIITSSVIAILEASAMVATWVWLQPPPKPQFKEAAQLTGKEGSQA
jgi:hypothetical protein